MRYLARSGGLLGFAELVKRYGYNPQTLLSDVGIPAAALQNPDLYVSYLKLARLYELCAQRLAEPVLVCSLGDNKGLKWSVR